MRGVLIDIANKIGDLWTSRLTSGRAAALDNLDAAVSTRAPSSTALSNAVWTPTRAGYLDSLAVAMIDTVVNSIQTGYIDVGSGTWITGTGEDLRYTDVAIVAVNLSKSVLQWTPGTWNGYPLGAIARLTSATNVRASVQDATSGFIRGRWTVIEYK